MCIDCLPKFMDLKIVKLLARNIQPILKLRKKAKGRTMQGVLSYKENFGLKVPIVNNIFSFNFFKSCFFLVYLP